MLFFVQRTSLVFMYSSVSGRSILETKYTAIRYKIILHCEALEPVILTLCCHVKEKSGLVEQLQKEKQKKGEQVQQAHADLARQAALIKDLQAHPRGKKELKEGGASLDQVHLSNCLTDASWD